MRGSTKRRIGIAGLVPALAMGWGAAGAQAADAIPTGNGMSREAEVSAGGRYVVFASRATNLVPGDTNGQQDVFIRDMVAGTTRLVSRPSSGQSNGPSWSPSVSGDGRFVAFSSDATNLVPGDTNGSQDIFRADLRTGEVIRVSVRGAKTQANLDSFFPQISDGGDAIVFDSYAGNLVGNDPYFSRHVYLRVVSAGTTTRLGPYRAGRSVDSAFGSISPDGTRVALSVDRPNTYSVAEWNRATRRLGLLATFSRDAVGRYGWGATATNAGSTYLRTWVDANASGYAVTVPRADGTSFEMKGSTRTATPSWLDGRAFDVAGRGGFGVIRAEYGAEKVSRLFVVDRDFVIGQDPESTAAASLTERAHDIAMSSDGSTVVFADADGQIKAWTWATGTIETASVGR